MWLVHLRWFVIVLFMYLYFVHMYTVVHQLSTVKTDFKPLLTSPYMHTNTAVLIMDDDIMASAQDIQFAFRVWKVL